MSPTKGSLKELRRARPATAGELGAQGVRIFADAHVKHGAHAIVQDRPIAELVRDVEFFNADVVIATGQRTGHAADLAYIEAIKSVASLPVLVGSGVTSENIGEILAVVDGVIVASALKVDGRWWNPVDPKRARQFVLQARPSRAYLILSGYPMSDRKVSFSERLQSQEEVARLQAAPSLKYKAALRVAYGGGLQGVRGRPPDGVRHRQPGRRTDSPASAASGLRRP